MIGRGRALVASVLALTLVGCGGGSSGQGGSSPPVSSPAPSPAPSAPPPIEVLPPFGFSAAFNRATQVGVVATEFRYLDSITNTYRTRLLDAKLLSATDTATLAFQPQPEAASLTYGGVTHPFATSDIIASGDPRGYRRDGKQLAFAFSGAAQTDLGISTFYWPEVAAVDAGQVGATRQFLFAPIGNISPVQTVIDGPIYFRAGPVIVGGDVYAKASLAQVRSIGTGVTLTFHLIRVVDAAEQVAGSVTLSGSHDPVTNLLKGTVVDADNTTVIGSFTGALYGPAREQLGVAFQFRRPQEGNRLYVGYYLAPRN